MFINNKMILVLTLTVMSLVSAKPGAMRNLKETEKSPVKVTRVKGKDDSDEVDLTLKMQSCEKGSDKCKEMIGDKDVKKASKEKFAKVLAKDMMSALDDDKEDEGDRKLAYYVCDYYYWCDCCYCYLLEDCYYI